MLVYEKEFEPVASLLGTGEDFALIAGPCAVEDMRQLEQVADALVRQGVRCLRAGAYKPRTSPYDFQGYGPEGLAMLRAVRERYGLTIVSEILDTRDVEAACGAVDVIQIGSRNMQNVALLKEVGMTGMPVLLKRGMMATLREFLLAAEYIVAGGNARVILCERGIRTFEDSTRFTLDIGGIALIKETTSLPVVADLSHSLGRKDILGRVARAVIAAGCDGIMVEVHPAPEKALSDAAQQLTLAEFDSFCGVVRKAGSAGL